jgi:hypothetical protein
MLRAMFFLNMNVESRRMHSKTRPQRIYFTQTLGQIYQKLAGMSREMSGPKILEEN